MAARKKTQTEPAKRVLTLPAEKVAAIAFEANRAYCREIGEREAQQPWEFAHGWQKRSCVNGIEAILENPDMTPEASHENWMAHKEAEGWTYGPEKSEAMRTHPCMVPYDELPEDQKVKDHLFHGIVSLFIADA